MQAPPPYTPTRTSLSSSSSSRLLALPQHLLLAIVTHLDLPTIIFSLRMTCRPLYNICMADARQRLLPSWTARVRQRGYTTAAGREDGSEAAGGGVSVLKYRSRETAVLDLFIASSALSILRGNESILLLPEDGDEAGLAVQDVLLMQPRAKLEDSVIQYSKADKVAYSASVGSGEGSINEGGGTILTNDITVQLSAREAKLMLPFLSSSGGLADSGQVRTVMRPVVEVARADRERLEVTADNLVRGLKDVRVWREEKGRRAWYERS